MEEDMRSLVIIVCFICALMLVSPVVSQDKQVTLAGKVTCAHCDLKVGTECATVIVVKENNKDVVYYLDEKSHKANHEAICSGAKEGSVTGTISQKEGKQVITASKVELKK
jgi:hypothetical protein